MRRLHEYIAENLALRKTEELLKQMGGKNVVVQKNYFQARFEDHERAKEVMENMEADGLSGFEIEDDPGGQGAFLKWHK